MLRLLASYRNIVVACCQAPGDSLVAVYLWVVIGCTMGAGQVRQTLALHA
jgi:hypothetical protein